MEYIDKKNIQYTVRSPVASDFERVKQICEARFGDGYLTQEEFSEWIKDADFCKVAQYGDTVEGIVYLMPENPRKLAKALKLDEDYVVNAAEGKDAVHSRCAALDEAYEGRGITPVLHNVIFDNLKKHGLSAVFAPAWTYDNYTPMGKLLDKFGFEFIGEKENIWYNMDGYTCIICKGKCKCKAAVYFKKI